MADNDNVAKTARERILIRLPAGVTDLSRAQHLRLYDEMMRLHAAGHDDITASLLAEKLRSSQDTIRARLRHLLQLGVVLQIPRRGRSGNNGGYFYRPELDPEFPGTHRQFRV